MSYALNYQPDAEKDVEAAFEWNEEKRRGLGNEFLDELEAAEKRIAKGPSAFPRKHRELRRCSTKRFKYGIFYFIEEEKRVIQVVGVFHHRQNPVNWQQRHDEWLDG